MEIYIDFLGDFIDANDYRGPDKAPVGMIVNLELYIKETLKTREEVTITFKKLED